MADADLDIVIRTLAKQHNKSLMAAAKKRHDQFMARSAKAKDKEAKAQYRHLAKSTLLHATATAKTAANLRGQRRRQLCQGGQESRGRRPAEEGGKEERGL